MTKDKIQVVAPDWYDEQCTTCKSKEDIKVAIFRAGDVSLTSTRICLCADCRAYLAIKLFKSL